MRSVELTLTPDTDAAFRAAWAALDDAGVPSSGRSTSPTNRPHVTLAAGPSLVVPSWPAALHPPASLLLGGLTLFPAGRGRSVLVRAVVVDRALAAFHGALHDLVPGALEQTLPDRWSPHVTLARRLTPEEVALALPALAELPPMPEAAVAGVRFWDGDARQVTPLA
jgi:2'-5' RNA ligase